MGLTNPIKISHGSTVPRDSIRLDQSKRGYIQEAIIYIWTRLPRKRLPLTLQTWSLPGIQSPDFKVKVRLIFFNNQRND